MKLLHVVGNRPQFVKLAPLLAALRDETDVYNVIVHSGQHYDYEMSKVFFNTLKIRAPDHNLEVGPGTHGVQTGRALSRLDAVLQQEVPTGVVVYGDTNTTLAGALAACKLGFPVAHVEAGLREHTWRIEEINRKLTDHLCRYLFCPTSGAAEFLRRENLTEERIFVTGDITYDAFLASCHLLESEPIEGEPVPTEPYTIMTLHRAETVDDPETLAEIVETIRTLDMLILLPLHPRTSQRLGQYGLQGALEDSAFVRLLPPLSYYSFLRLLLAADLVITDSGGVIKEAFYARKPCVTLDFTSEYTEIYESGANVLAGKTKASILEGIAQVREADMSRVSPEALFGDGKAAEAMVRILVEGLGSAC